jgi:hypothetical protein
MVSVIKASQVDNVCVPHRRLVLNKAALVDIILDHDDMEYIGTLKHNQPSTSTHGFRCLHKQYSYDISLEEGLAVVLSVNV